MDDLEIESKWLQGRYEIIDGVLTTMPPAYFIGTQSLQELVFVLKAYLKNRGLPNHFGGEADIIIDEDRVVVADTVWMTLADQERQREAAKRAGRRNTARTRILVPPTLVIESISPGHERHDERTKRRWYAEFGVPNYWILNAFARSLRCLARDGTDFRIDAEGSGNDHLRPSLFPGVDIELAPLWLDA